MRIKSLSFRNVGPFGAEGIRLDGFTPGLNVVCETNEFGKSSILEALEIVLFRPFSSTKADVRQLVHTNSKGGFEGEICFFAGDRDYRFTKRFLKSKGARLQDEHTGEELAIDRAAEEALATLLRSDKFAGGPAGLLWVRQGHSMEEISDDGQIASRLEGELGTLVGGERARDYLERVTRELAEIITAGGKPKKGGALNLAQEAVQSTEAELAEATRLRDRTTSIGVELDKVTTEIEQVSQTSDDADLARQIHETREAMVEARGFADALALMEARYSEASAKAERAESRQADHITAQVSFDETVKQLKQAELSQAQETNKLKDLTRRRAEMRDKIVEAEARQDDLAKARMRQEARAREGQRLEMLQQQLQHLRSRLDQLDVLETEQATLTAQIADLPAVTRADVELLRRAEFELRQCEAELTGFSTRLYLELSKAGQGKVTLDGQPLPTGPFELSGGQSLRIEGVGHLWSDDSRLRETARNRDRAAETFNGQLESFGVPNLQDATKFADQRQALEAERKRVTMDMSRLAPEGRAAIETDFSRAEAEARELVDRLESEPPNVSPTEATDVLEDLRGERAKLDVLDENLTLARQKLSGLETDEARLRERLSGLNLSPDEAERQAEADKLAGEKIKADSDVRALRVELEALKSRAPKHSLDMLTARLTRLEQVAGQSRERLEALKTKAAALRARRDAAFDGADAEAAVSALVAQLTAQQAELARQERAKAVRLLLRDTLTETQNRLREAYTAPVTQEIAPLLSRVIPGAQAGLGETLGVDTVFRDGKAEKIGQLSGGTQEQFAILTRLAYARLLARSGASAPVILDDALVYADDARREAMFDVLGLVSSGEMPIQIVYLSCHAGATARLGGTRIHPQSW